MGTEDLDDLVEHLLHVEDSEADESVGFDFDTFWDIAPFERT